jgi:hypothetical protein
LLASTRLLHRQRGGDSSASTPCPRPDPGPLGAGRPRLDVARRRPGRRGLRIRSCASVCGRAAPRGGHRLGGGRTGRCSGDRERHVRGLGADERADRHDRDVERPRRHADASRLAGRREGRRRGRGSDDGYRRSERHAGGRGAVRPPRGSLRGRSERLYRSALGSARHGRTALRCSAGLRRLRSGEAGDRRNAAGRCRRGIRGSRAHGPARTGGWYVDGCGGACGHDACPRPRGAR